MANKDAKNTAKTGDTKVAEKAAEVKENVAAKAAEVKAAVKEDAPKAAKEVAKKVEKAAKTTAKKATNAKKAVKKTVKKTAAKAAAKVAAPGTKMLLQFGAYETELNTIEDKIKAQFIAEGHRAGNIKTLNIYVKPEDGNAYYVINDKFSGSIKLF